MLTISVRLPRDRFVLDVDVSLETNAIWAIMGYSGCGKTSFLRAIAGLEPSVNGRITFNDRVWLDTTRKVRVAPEHRRIGYIFQESRLFPHLDVMGNLQFARQRARRNDINFTHVVEQVGISHLLNRQVQALSGGEKQRVAIARALMNGPDLLLMDEPLASLDWASKVTIFPILRNIQKTFGVPVVFVSHTREEVARLADKLILIDHGRVMAKGSCQQLFSRFEPTLSGDISDDNSAISILETSVLNHDEHGLTRLSLGQKVILVNQVDAEQGAPLRVLLQAHEVSVATEYFECTSIQNRLPVSVQRMEKTGNRNFLLALSVEGQIIQALITCKAVEDLDIDVGKQIFAYFKASSLNVV